MHFEANHLYHIYNQGNNGQKIFFTRENYLFFLKKIQDHLLLHCDLLAWCLMPNHFHLMVKVRDDSSDEYVQKIQPNSEPDYQHDVNSRTPSTEALNKAIGIILASYTRAINKQQNRSGSLFQAKTKAICLTQNETIAKVWFQQNGITQINVDHPEMQYPNLCYQHILSNHV